jgi:hypothetical protein
MELSGCDVDSEREATAVGPNPQQSFTRSRVPTPISSWKTNFDAQEAVLDCYKAAEAHIAPHGRLGERQQEALKNLKELWGYVCNVRTMQAWVQELLDRHEPRENRLDSETGTEYNRSDVQVGVRLHK